MFKFITYTIDGAVARIMMNRPEKANAQNHALLCEIDEAFTQADKDKEVRVIILGGNGKHFSTGHDIMGSADPDREIGPKGMYDGMEDHIDYEAEYFFNYCLHIRDISKPTIAQVQGACVSGAYMMASMCDLIIASEDAFFSDPVVRMCCSSIELLTHPWDLGMRRAKEMIFLGERISAQELKQAGAINRVVPRERLEAEVEDIAQRLANTPPTTLKMAKKSLNYTQDAMGYKQALEYHFLMHNISHRTKESDDFWAAAKTTNFAEFLAKRDGKK
ncbi:MAG: enoyl-CoA hydratase [Bacillota bacterium]